jgi:MSHA biogenesis protein MshK
MHKTEWRTWFAAAALGLLTAGVLAQGLDDPTRPPAAFQAIRGKAAGETNVPAQGLVLQSVIITQAGRSAIISGKHVAVGAKIGNARLVKVADSEVVLLAGNERRTLKLFPGVDKRAATRVDATQREPRGVER